MFSYCKKQCNIDCFISENFFKGLIFIKIISENKDLLDISQRFNKIFNFNFVNEDNKRIFTF